MLLTIALVGLAHALGTSVVRHDRLAWLDSHPGDVREADVAHRIASALPVAEARRTSRLLRRRQVQPFTAWAYLDAYGAPALALALRLGLTHHDLLDVLAATWEVTSDEPVADWEFPYDVWS